MRVKLSHHNGTGRPVLTLSPPIYDRRESEAIGECLGAVGQVAFPPWPSTNIGPYDTILTV
jgi:hypothetical protein